MSHDELEPFPLHLRLNERDPKVAHDMIVIALKNCEMHKQKAIAKACAIAGTTVEEYRAIADRVEDGK